MEERRLFKRISLKCELKFHDPLSGKNGKARTVDISANGTGFITDEILSPGSMLEIWLVIPDNHEPFYSKGEVVWAKDLTGTNKQRVGVHLGSPIKR